MSYRRIRFRCPRTRIEDVSAVLEAHRALAVSVENAGDDAYFEAAFPGTPTWAYGLVTGLFADTVDPAAIAAEVERRVGVGPPADVDTLADRDWERAWLTGYRPVEITEDLCVCPTWLDPPNPRATVVHLDPGLAFGTGTHVTTRLCLEAFTRIDWRDKTLIDYGCGSGILAIAALKLGAHRAVGIDIDPQALRASRANARRNGVSERFEAVHPEAFSGAPADVVAANILADVIVDLAYTLTRLITIPGVIVLTGILRSQAAKVIAAFAPCCALEAVDREGWSLLKGRRDR